MALIRQADAGRAAKDAIVLNLGDVVREGNGVLAAAQQQAEGILNRARLEREAIIAGAREEGLKAGHAEGLAKGETQGLALGQQRAQAEWNERLTAVQAGWGAALDTFVREREHLLAAARSDVLRLALNIARRVTLTTAQSDPTIVQSQLARVLDTLARPTRLKIRVHPLDRETSLAALPGLMQRYAISEHIEIVADATLARGSCIATSAGGELDASLNTMLDRIARAILPGEAAPADLRFAEPGPQGPQGPQPLEPQDEASPPREAA